MVSFTGQPVDLSRTIVEGMAASTDPPPACPTVMNITCQLPTQRRGRPARRCSAIRP